ncbi:hypothetical protein QR680_017637 [Steinernema hermaphroditum]|uniref:Uncharacterized protein n=1 Tax=Steinernema hermaphroditum TaxID=289476 RepID=A0AA39HHP1_9BILA|nr:hypothetical protein QR680_017637 [Steinernema hermaphroditum]
MSHTSPILSFFSRKKRINGAKSVDDIKTIANGRQRENAASLSPQTPRKSFAERIRDHKSQRAPATKKSMPEEEPKTHPRANGVSQRKALSVDAINQTQNDPAYLLEALETLAEEQPIVARSIPKHAAVKKPRDFREKSLENCIFDETVYDAMLSESLKVCDLLQDHLSECIVEARAKSPDRCLYYEYSRPSTSTSGTHSVSGRVHSPLRQKLSYDATADDGFSFSDDGSSSRITTIESPVFHTRKTASTNPSTSSPTPPRSTASPPLKSIVQYNC